MFSGLQVFNFQDYGECGRPRSGVWSQISKMIDELGATLIQLLGEDVQVEVNIAIKFKYVSENSYFGGMMMRDSLFPDLLHTFNFQRR